MENPKNKAEELLNKMLSKNPNKNPLKPPFHITPSFTHLPI
jgi:hypothetical protein